MTSLRDVGQCEFYMAWRGPCAEPTTIKHDGLFFCARHAKMVCCICGKQATYNCPETVGPLICGAPTCYKHRRRHARSHF